jgi:hypothetical protein
MVGSVMPGKNAKRSEVNRTEMASCSHDLPFEMRSSRFLFEAGVGLAGQRRQSMSPAGE